jgi:hypothetical protein
MNALRSVVLQAYDLPEDDRTMRSIERVPENARAEFFERLRSEYAFRLEFRHFLVESAGEDSVLAPVLTALGFNLDVG